MNDKKSRTEFGIGILVRDAYFALRRCSNAICQKHECNGDQFVVMKYLADLGPLTQKQLCEFSGHDSSTIAAMVRSLERRELITRQPHPVDSRAKLVKLTRQGKIVQQKLWAETNGLREKLWSTIPKNQQAQFTENLQAITNSMKNLRSEILDEDLP